MRGSWPRSHSGPSRFESKMSRRRSRSVSGSYSSSGRSALVPSARFNVVCSEWPQRRGPFTWTDRGKCQGTSERPGEGPYVFDFAGKTWMLVDVWKGIGVYHSEDLLHWTVQTQDILKEPGRGAALAGRDRAEARVERHKRSAADRDARRGAGHQVVVAGPVIALVVADRADHSQLVGEAGHGRYYRRFPTLDAVSSL